MVRVDSLNQRIIAAKDSVIAADSTMIAALQRVRAAGIRAVEAEGCHVLFLKCPSRTTTGLVALGAGVVLGYSLARH